MAGAEELHRQAQRAANRGSFGRAAALLDRASRSATDPDVLTRVELTRAYVEAETGRAGPALERCESLLERELQPTTRGLVWSQLALLRLRTGALAGSLTAFEQAIALLSSDPENLGRALLNRGNVHLQSGQVAAAVADFTAARDQLAPLEDLKVERAKAEHNLGYARLLTGDLVGALRMIEDAAEVLAPLSSAFRATVEQDRAEVLTAAGRPREAMRSLEASAAAYGARGLRTFQADCELTLAWTVLREDPARARVVARRAARHFRGQASPARAVQADAAAVVAEISAGARSPSALLRADALASDLLQLRLHRDAAVLQLQAARLAVRRDDLVGARRRVSRVRLDPRSPLPVRLLMREVRAEIATARHDPRHALHHVRAGLEELHTWQSSFGSLDLQSTLVGHGRTLAVRGLELALADGRPEQVLEWSERARALVGRVTPVHPPADEQVAADLTELRLVQSQSPARGTAGWRRAELLRQRVRQRQWYAEGAGTVTEPAHLAEVRSALDEDGAALVAHVVVGDRVTALVVTGEEARVVPLGHLAPVRDRLDAVTADLTLAAGHRHDGLAAPLRAALRARLADVAERLVEPLAGLLGERRLVLTPSGALASTPWSLLPGLLGRPITIPPSATRWLALRESHPDPGLSKPGSSGPGARRVGLVAGPGVARGEEEARRSAAAWGDASVLCGDAATAAAVSRLAERVDVLHLAGHGRHTGENPLFSAVELADGPWFGYDIERLASVPDTVVLSACELGRVSVRAGEEAVGMSAAWLHAGARTVLSSPVLLADDVACEVFSHWHALVASGSAPADALAEVCGAAEDVVPLLCFGAGW